MKAQWISKAATAASLALALGGTVFAAEDRGQLSEKDYKFATEALRGGMEEVQMGEIAGQKGSIQAVRDFGQQMVTDHSKMNDELKQILAQKGATLPATLTDSQKHSVEHLQKASTPSDFDKGYTKDMVKDHKKDVEAFKKAATNLSDPDLRAFAQKNLPILQHHALLAEDLETTVHNEK